MEDTLYRWVKASERPVPKDYSKINFRDADTKAPFSTLVFESAKRTQQLEFVEWLEPIPSPGDNQSLEQDFKELNHYLDDIYKQGVNGEKDAGNLWIQFTDKFSAFQKKVLAGAAYVKGGEGLVDELRKANPYQSETKEGWKKCCDKLKELLTQQK